MRNKVKEGLANAVFAPAEFLASCRFTFQTLKTEYTNFCHLPEIPFPPLKPPK